jgi:hypothetical protein
LLPADARGDAYADKIIDVMADPAGYDALVVSTRNEFEDKLNWDAWGRAMRPIFEKVLQRSIDPRTLFHDDQAVQGKSSPTGQNDGSPELASSFASEVSRT